MLEAAAGGYLQARPALYVPGAPHRRVIQRPALRYKYLYLQNRQDRSLVDDIGRLETRIRQQRGELVNVQEDLDRRREERASELKSYEALADERSAKLGRLRKSSESTQLRISALGRDEARLNDVLAGLERAPSLSPGGCPSQCGELPGTDHGRSRLARLAGLGEDSVPVRTGHTAERRRDPAQRNRHRRDSGTPVKAVSSGLVKVVQRLGAYGLTVVVEHGNSYSPVSLGTSAVAVERQSRKDSRSARWAAVTPTRGPTCTSRSGERIDRAGSGGLAQEAVSGER